MSTILDKVKGMLASQDNLLSPQPGDFTPGCPKLKALIETRVNVMAMYQNRDYPSYHLLGLLFMPWLFSAGTDDSSSKRVQRRPLEWR